MSYNIDSWKTKKIDGLLIPRAALQPSEDAKRRGWKTTETMGEQGPDGIGISIGIGCEGDDDVIGILRPDGMILVGLINLRGEGSGSSYRETLMPALKQSAGYLEAVLIWEGGDSVSRLIADNGKVTEKEVDL